MKDKISIRNAPTAIPGLQDMIMYVQKTGGVHFSKFVMAEIGSYVGDSTQVFAVACKEIHCIDPWQNGYDDNDPSSYKYDMKIIEAQFDEVADRFHNVIKHKMTSVKGAEEFEDESLDFIYIDGLHTYEGVIDDIKAWVRKVKPDGWVGGHDYGHKLCPGVKQAVDELLGIPEKRFQDTSWVIKRDRISL